jgi:hypothetical protein
MREITTGLFPAELHVVRTFVADLYQDEDVERMESWLEAQHIYSYEITNNLFAGDYYQFPSSKGHEPITLVSIDFLFRDLEDAERFDQMFGDSGAGLDLITTARRSEWEKQRREFMNGLDDYLTKLRRK